MKLAMIVTTRTQPGARAEVHDAFLRHLAPRALANDAQELVLWCDDNDPDVFHLVEIYDSPDAAAEAGQAPWFWEYLAAVGPLLQGEPVIRTATPVWAKGLAQ